MYLFNLLLGVDILSSEHFEAALIGKGVLKLENKTSDQFLVHFAQI